MALNAALLPMATRMLVRKFLNIPYSMECFTRTNHNFEKSTYQRSLPHKSSLRNLAVGDQHHTCGVDFDLMMCGKPVHPVTFFAKTLSWLWSYILASFTSIPWLYLSYAAWDCMSSAMYRHETMYAHQICNTLQVWLPLQFAHLSMGLLNMTRIVWPACNLSIHTLRSAMIAGSVECSCSLINRSGAIVMSCISSLW